jgi:GNAT superfamily N-acetyltransferase
MTIRPAEESDIPSIVELLKLSLGESLMPKSETFWRWKHIDNPFGRSPVLLAFENNKLIGVRAFMRWEWRQGEKIIKAVRAVDTATHPNYQGQGIFSNLTRQLVDQCRDEGVDFIFNTPNKKSMPGYVKLGWSSLGRLPIRLNPVLNGRVVTKETVSNASSLTIGSFEFPSSDRLTTHYSTRYLQWRYADNPNADYHLLQNKHDNPDYLVFYRLKKFSLGIEFRVCDAILLSPQAGQEMNRHIKRTARQTRSILISGMDRYNSNSLLRLPAGPIVTVNNLSNTIKPLNFQTWNPSLGDLEMF